MRYERRHHKCPPPPPNREHTGTSIPTHPLPIPKVKAREEEGKEPSQRSCRAERAQLGHSRGRQLRPPPARGRQARHPPARSLRRPRAPFSRAFAPPAPPRSEEARPRPAPPCPPAFAHPRTPSPPRGLSPGQSPWLRRPPACGSAAQRRPAPLTLSAGGRSAAPTPRPRLRASGTARTAEGRSLRRGGGAATGEMDGRRGTPRGGLRRAPTRGRPPRIPSAVPGAARYL